MIRSSVLLPHPDGPMSDTNSPRAIDRSIPDSAVVLWSPIANTFATPASRTTSGAPADAWPAGRETEGWAAVIAKGLPRQVQPRASPGRLRMSRISAPRTIEKNAIPRAAATTMAAHSFSGPVM